MPAQWYLTRKKKEQTSFRLLLFSMHDDDAIDSNVNSLSFWRPKIVLFYISTKASVDTVDKLKEHYSDERTSRSWPMMVFYSLPNIATFNSVTISKKMFVKQV